MEAFLASTQISESPVNIFRPPVSGPVSLSVAQPVARPVSVP